MKIKLNISYLNIFIISTLAFFSTLELSQIIILSTLALSQH